MNNNTKQLDSYSMLIVSKYFKSENDFINTMCVCKKFKETTEKLRFNPIPITSLKLFPKIQTQHLYTNDDVFIEGIDSYEIIYCIDYEQYLNLKQDNIKCHHVIYSLKNISKFGNEIPDKVTMLGDNCFDYRSSLTSINLPTSLTSLGKECFSSCSSLQSINLPSSLQSLSDCCFLSCDSLTSITLPSSITSLGYACFSGCLKLSSINLPFTLTSISKICFCYCFSLTTITIPTTLTTFGIGCFYGCHELRNNISLPDICFEKPPEFI
ncbi:Leucine rich repeat containing protein BspA family protein [Entamoeba marina]